MQPPEEPESNWQSDQKEALAISAKESCIRMGPKIFHLDRLVDEIELTP